VFEKMLSWWILIRTTTKRSLIILTLPSLKRKQTLVMPTTVPRYLHLDLSKQVMRNVSRRDSACMSIL